MDVSGAGGGSSVPVPTGRSHETAPHVLVLLAGLAAGTVAQGGYYTAGRVLIAFAVILAAVAAWRVGSRGYRTRIRPLAASAAALSLWALVRAVPSGGYADAVAATATLGCLVAAVAILARTVPEDRERMALALIGFGAAMGLLAWAGVAWRLPRFAVLVDRSVWRGGATLTYPNAAAALLATLALVAIALLVARPRSPYRLLCAYLLLVGLSAALSRAGAVALLAGLAVLAVLIGPRVVLARMAPLALGTLVALGALAPSFPASGHPHPLAALLGLVAGGAAAVALASVQGWVRAASWTAAAVLAVAALASQAGSPGMRQVVGSRWSLGSYGRSMGAQAALGLVRERPLAGTGIGQAWLSWSTADGNAEAAQYVHDEYLQILVDLGAVGAVLLLVLIAALLRAVTRDWTRRPVPLLRAGAVAALAAFAVHSGFDFLWHIAVLPLLAGLYAGLATPYPLAPGTSPGAAAASGVWPDGAPDGAEGDAPRGTRSGLAELPEAQPGERGKT